ncbi:MAG: YdeI/OmpD-associated family protein [Gemmatimonadales bacterium]
MQKKDTRPALVVPPDLKAALAKDSAAKAVFDALAYTHRKEHIQAIVEAKKPETRERRLAKTMSMLASERPSLSNTISTAVTVNKMKLKPGQRVLVLDADADAMVTFKKLPKETTLATEAGKGGFDVVVLYAESAAKLAKRLPAAIKAGVSGGALWIAFPKKRPGHTSTLTRDNGWESTDRDDIVKLSLIAIDAIWSGAKYRIT